MQIPESLLASLQGVKGFDKEAFADVHASGEQVTSVRLNPFKRLEEFPIPVAIGSPIEFSKIPWTEYGYYLSQRPSFTFDPLFHAGCYYVQEASSMFLEHALKQTTDVSKPLKVLDLCAAPGGKSTHIQSLISSDSLLVSNEVIRSRANILKDNIIKWGCGNVVVTNNDPADFGRLENYFDVIVVDAPCSGSGLFRKEPEAISEWSENNVQLCSQRQQRILADVLPALKKEGVLIYSTCSYSKEEDEEIADWLTKERLMLPVQLPVSNAWDITATDGGYRFWPDKVKGEGFFISCFKNKVGDEKLLKVKNKPALLSKAEAAVVQEWVKPGGKIFIKNNQTIYAWPEGHFNEFSLLPENLKVIYSGILVGELVREKLVPDHALAMSGCVPETIARTGLNKDQAIAYLQKKDIGVHTSRKGWQLVTYLDQPLGWINALPNRINNYYPKELRILKDR